MPAQPLELKLRVNQGDIIDGKYRVVKKLGEGGCGSVFRCQLLSNPEELVAIKVLENASDLPRFEREREVLRKARNSHHVVGYRSTGQHHQFPYVAMEHMAGGSLRDLLDKRKSLPVAEAAWVAIMVVRGLREAATVHRDLKPENLLLTRPGDGRGGFIIGNIRKGLVVKVADFGLAKLFDVKRTKLTMTGQIMGTPLYMSPEQCQNTKDVTERSDIYSLGIILYEMVTGDTPFTSTDPYVLLKMHCEEEPRFPRMDPQMLAVIQRCLKKNPQRRYQTLNDLEEDLACVAGLKARRASPSSSGPGLPESLRWLLVGVSLVIFLVLAYLLRDRIMSSIDAWWNPAPTKRVQQRV